MEIGMVFLSLIDPEKWKEIVKIGKIYFFGGLRTEKFFGGK